MSDESKGGELTVAKVAVGVVVFAGVAWGLSLVLSAAMWMIKVAVIGGGALLLTGWVLKKLKS